MDSRSLCLEGQDRPAAATAQAVAIARFGRIDQQIQACSLFSHPDLQPRYLFVGAVGLAIEVAVVLIKYSVISRLGEFQLCASLGYNCHCKFLCDGDWDIRRRANDTLFYLQFFSHCQGHYRDIFFQLSQD